MINLKIKIIGDPEFIKTDDIFYNVGNVESIGPDETHAPDGSILMDRGDIFVLITWKTPVDIDFENTGLPDFQRYQYSVFDGVFKVVKVNSEFKGGKFEQNIELIRFHDAVKDPDISKSIEERGGQFKNITVTQLDSGDTTPELPEGSTSDVDAARDVANTENTDTDGAKNNKLSNIADNGQEKTAEQQAADSASAQDGTIPNSGNAQAQSPQSDTGPKVKDEGGAQSKNETPSKVTKNLPDGVTVDANGLYIYRDVRFSANDNADLQAKIGAIDNGTKVKTTITDGSGNTRNVEFDGSQTRPASKDADIAKIQEEYEKAKSNAWNSQRRLNNANSGMFDDDPSKKQHVIDLNTKQLDEANAKMAVLEAQLKDKGAAPR